MYDVIVIGAGHAGCEASLAAARMGCRTLLLTMNLDNVALMSCNPSIGGPAKGHVVREIDALGGEMARNIDKTFIQIRMLNTGKGPAVQALRAQADKKLYSLSMKHTLERQPNLDIKQALVEELTVNEEPESVLEVKTNTGAIYDGKTIVLTTGTSLGGRVIVGDTAFPAGRAGEFGAYGLSQSLERLGFTLGRLKTGTPPRLDARTIDFSRAIAQPGSEEPLCFSFTPAVESPYRDSPNPVYPQVKPIPWRQQIPCYLVYTNERTHEIIRSNLHRAPLFTGFISGVGPRYCPSIEDKIVRFGDKDKHGLFLEPEGWATNEVYVQGANTSLPEDVQLAMLHTIPALEKVEMMRVGYAIEYDYVPPSQTMATLESKLIPGLFFAGQINGTSGYEEAAGQGLVAGINAALKVKGEPSLILRRNQSYIGVMIDDLVTRELIEPYRLLTSRAEYRLLLRQDNADLRLTPVGYSMGLITEKRYREVEKKRNAVDKELKRLARTYFSPGERLLIKRSKDPDREPLPKWLRFLRSLFSGLYTVDNMDFVLRDAYMSGYSPRAFDLDRLLHYSTFTEKGLTIHERGLSALVRFIAVRAELFRAIYFHRTVRAIDLSLQELFADSKQYLFPGNPSEHLAEYQRLTEWSLLVRVADWSGSSRPVLRELGRRWRCFLGREVRWKMACERTIFFKPGEAERSSVFSGQRTFEEAVRNELPAELKDLPLRVDTARHVHRPNSSAPSAGQNFLYDPATDQARNLDDRELFRQLPLAHRICRIYAEDDRYKAQLAAAMDKLTGTGGADDATNM